MVVEIKVCYKNYTNFFLGVFFYHVNVKLK